MLAVQTPMFVWYLMRGSGVVAFVLLSITMALGVVGVNRWRSTRWPRLVTSSLHRNLSLLAMCFLGVHVATAVLDSWVGLSWLGVLVPFRSHYRPLWIGMGVVASDLLLAVIGTSLLRRHIGYRAWRAVHWGTWLMWPLALVHMLGAGTDTGAPWSLAVTVACTALVAASLAWRLAGAARTRRPGDARLPALRPPAPGRSAGVPRAATMPAERRLTTTGSRS